MNINGLLKLEDRIKSLPKQTILQSQISIFNNFSQLTSIRNQELSKAIVELKSLRLISSNKKLMDQDEDRCKQTVKKLIDEASSLLKVEVVNGDGLHSKLNSIARSISNLSNEILREWTEICHSYQERILTFKPLVSRINANVASQFKDIESLIRPGVTPLPINDEAIQAVIDSRLSLTTLMSSLKIDGSVETFLQASLRGDGDPKALLDPDVIAYINANPTMWKSLKVVLK
jgi:hypothetical protein